MMCRALPARGSAFAPMQEDRHRSKADNPNRGLFSSSYLANAQVLEYSDLSTFGG